MFEVGGKPFAVILFLLTILYAVICCAVFSMEVNDNSTERALIVERRAKTGLKWVSLGAFIITGSLAIWYMPNKPAMIVSETTTSST